MSQQATQIDVNVLHAMRAMCANMVEHHGNVAEKERVNAVMAAAGLTPPHNEFSLRWDRDQGAKYRSFVEQLDALIALHGDRQAEAA